jgi:uncharacterized transporter YbjL
MTIQKDVNNVSSLNKEELKQKKENLGINFAYLAAPIILYCLVDFGGCVHYRGEGPYRAIGSFYGTLTSTSALSGDIALQDALMDGYTSSSARANTI